MVCSKCGATAQMSENGKVFTTNYKKYIPRLFDLEPDQVVWLKKHGGQSATVRQALKEYMENHAG